MKKLLLSLVAIAAGLYLFLDIAGMDADGIPMPLIAAGILASILLVIVGIVLIMRAE
jgi:hypothetical protein